jgi:hypothetical protein
MQQRITMPNFTVTIEINNNAIKGNTKTVKVTVPDEQLADLTKEERELEIDAYVAEEVLAHHVCWDWKDAE